MFSQSVLTDKPNISVRDGLLVQIFGEEGKTPEDQNAQIQFQDESLFILILVRLIPTQVGHEFDPGAPRI